MTTHAFAPRFDLSNVFMPAREVFADDTLVDADATEQEASSETPEAVKNRAA